MTTHWTGAEPEQPPDPPDMTEVVKRWQACADWYRSHGHAVPQHVLGGLAACQSAAHRQAVGRRYTGEEDAAKAVGSRAEDELLRAPDGLTFCKNGRGYHLAAPDATVTACGLVLPHGHTARTYGVGGMIRRKHICVRCWDHRP